MKNRNDSTMNDQKKTIFHGILSMLTTIFATVFTVVFSAGFSAGLLHGADVLSVSSGEGKPGDRNIQVIVTAQNDLPIHGYSLALSFPTEVLEITDISIDGTHVAPLEPEFVAPKTDNALGIATMGVIIDFNDPVTPTALASTIDDDTGADLPPNIVARLTFNIRPEAIGGLYPIRLVDGVGNPATHNRFTNSGISITPELNEGAVLVEGGNVLELQKSIAIAGAAPAIPLTLWALHPDELDGFTIAIAFDCQSEVIEYKSSTFTGTDLDFLLGAPEFFVSGLSDDFECRVETAALFEYAEPIDLERKLPPALDPEAPQSIMNYVFAAGSAADDDKQWQDLILENRDNPVATNNLFFVGARSVSTRGIHGKIYFSQGNLTGKVIETISGKPVSGCKVTLSPEPCPTEAVDCENSAITNANGDFLMNGLIPGIYTVKLSKLGYYNAVHEDIEITGSFSTSDAGDLSIYKVPSVGAGFLRGDANNDTRPDISDSVYILDFLFRGGPPFPCNQAADANNDNKADISDAVWILNFFFLGGPAIPPPNNACGPDPDAGPLTCEEPNCP